MIDKSNSSEPGETPEMDIATADNEQPQGKGVKRPSRNSIIFMVLIVVAVGIVLNTWGLLPFGQGVVKTENAYLKGDVTVISPQVGGYVTKVNVSDFDEVKESDVLLTIDSRRFEQRVAQARAQISADEAALSNVGLDRRSADAQIRLRQANVTTARAEVNRLQADYDRVSSLLPSGAVSQREHDQVEVALQNARSSLTQALSQLDVARSSRSSVDVGQRRLNASLSGAAAARELAQIDLDNSTITAPRDGALSEVTVQLGQLVSPGTQLMYLVPKET